ncbi:MAG: MarR family transcriptional regulator [Acinetobacter sp.]
MQSDQLLVPSCLEDHLGFWLRFVSNHVSMRFQKLLENENVTVTEWVALRTLWNENESSHAALIESLGMTKGAASKVINRLEQKGLAERKLVDGRAREQKLSLTSKGKMLVPRLAQLADENDDYFFAHLSQSEQNAFIDTLKSLVKHHQLKEIPTS